MYLLCYGRSDKADNTIRNVLSGSGGRRIGSTEIFASDLASPGKEPVCLVLVLPLEAACGIVSRNLSSELSSVPVICVSPEGKFAAAIRYGSVNPAEVTAAVNTIARSLGSSCFTDFGSIADIAFVELRLRIDGTAMTRLQVIDDDDILSLGHELMHSMGTDIAGTAANKNRHIGIFLSSCFLF